MLGTMRLVLLLFCWMLFCRAGRWVGAGIANKNLCGGLLCFQGITYHQCELIAKCATVDVRGIRKEAFLGHDFELGLLDSDCMHHGRERRAAQRRYTHEGLPHAHAVTRTYAITLVHLRAVQHEAACVHVRRYKAPE